MSIQLKIKKIFNWLGVRTQSDKQNEDILLNSELFNEHWYLSQYPEVKMAPLKHFLYFGGFEGKNPSPDFDTDFYLSNNDDVKNSPLNPLIHYLCFGLHEERKIRPVVQSKKVTSKKLADLDVKECVAILERSELFDAVWYLRVNGVEGVSFAEASKHYVQEGWRLGFDPSPRFSTEYYLTCNGDVAKTGVNPLIHYLTIGKANKLPSSKSRYATYNLIGDIAVENHEVKHPIVTGLLHGGKPSVPVEQQPQFLLEELEKFDCKDEPFIRSALSVFNILSTKTVESRLLDELNTLQWRSGR